MQAQQAGAPGGQRPAMVDLAGRSALHLVTAGFAFIDWLAALGATRRSVLACALLGLLVLAEALAPRVSITIDPARMRPDAGHAYKFIVDGLPPWPFVVPADVPEGIRGPVLQLLENGRHLGPQRSQHLTIREQGAGAYSHWGNVVRFSTRDNSDPRRNGHSYRIEARTALASHVRWLLGFGGVALLAVTYPGVVLRVGQRVFRPQGARLSPWAAGAIALALVLALVGGLAWRMTHGLGPQLSLAGYYPLSDAFGYMTCALQINAYGTVPLYADFCSRRILYPLLLTGAIQLAHWDWALAILGQAALLATTLAGLWLVARRGLGVVGASAALTVLVFFAGVHALGLFMTEVSGLLLGVAAFATLLCVRRGQDFRWTVPMVALFSIGMVSRAGAMFSLGALVLGAAWLIWCYAGRARVLWLPLLGFAASVGFLAQNGANHLLALPTDNTFGNFATVIYRLSIGARDWLQAYADFKDSFAQESEVDTFRRLYAAAFANILERPWVIVFALFSAMKTYLASLFIYGELARFKLLCSLLLVAGVIDCLRHRHEPQRLLLLLAFAGEVASAPFIVQDGGIRVFAVTLAARALLVGYGARLLGSLLLTGIARVAEPVLAQTPMPSVFATRDASTVRPWLPLAAAGAALALGILPLLGLHGRTGWPALSGLGCPAGQHEVLADLRAGSMAITARADDRAGHLWPFEVPYSGVRAAVAGAWYGASIEALAPPWSMIHAVQRLSDGLGTFHPIMLFDVPAAGLPPVSSLCVDDAARVTVADQAYYRAVSVRPAAPAP